MVVRRVIDPIAAQRSNLHAARYPLDASRPLRRLSSLGVCGSSLSCSADADEHGFR